MTSDGALTILKNDEVDALVAKAQGEADPDERAALLQEANALVHDLAPWVFMHQQYSVYGVSDDVDWEPRADELVDPYTATRK